MSVGSQELADLSHIIQNAQSQNSRTNYDLRKMIEDDKVYELLFTRHPEFASLEPMFSPLMALTYLPSRDSVSRRHDVLRGMALIMECYVDERDTAALEFLFALQQFGETQAYDSMGGFKATTVTENKVKVEASGLSPKQEKKKFLGLF